MCRLSWALALVVAGCFTPDLGEGQVLCGVDDACPPSYVCRADGRCYHDAGDGGATDLAGSVADLGNGGAARCARACPPTSSCAAGVCTPPSGATMCQRAQDCHNGQVCDEYNVGGMLHGFCTPPSRFVTSWATRLSVKATERSRDQEGIDRKIKRSKAPES